MNRLFISVGYFFADNSPIFEIVSGLVLQLLFFLLLYQGSKKFKTKKLHFLAAYFVIGFIISLTWIGNSVQSHGFTVTDALVGFLLLLFWPFFFGSVFSYLFFVGVG